MTSSLCFSEASAISDASERGRQLCRVRLPARLTLQEILCNRCYAIRSSLTCGHIFCRSLRRPRA
eukprot:5670977-Karenia_brevis.AAC.1